VVILLYPAWLLWFNTRSFIIWLTTASEAWICQKILRTKSLRNHLERKTMPVKYALRISIHTHNKENKMKEYVHSPSLRTVKLTGNKLTNKNQWRFLGWTSTRLIYFTKARYWFSWQIHSSAIGINQVIFQTRVTNPTTEAHAHCTGVQNRSRIRRVNMSARWIPDLETSKQNLAALCYLQASCFKQRS
jgi:hypothetical protein